MISPRIPTTVPQLPKAMTTIPRRLTAAVLVFIMLAAAITAAAASGTPQPSPLNASLPENSPAGASLGTPMETTAPAGTVSYSLSGPDAGLFDIDPATGEITLAQGASPDFETRTSYAVTITASANLVVSVENVDEPGSVSLSTGSPRSGEALSASLTDPDGSVSALSWRWQRSTEDGGEDGWEDIPDATAPDYTPGAGDVGRRLQAIAAYDDGSGHGRTAQAATGEPVRNDPPEFGADATNLAVDENTAPGTPVGDPITAADPNGDDVTHSLTGSGEFTVDPQTGQISVAEGAALDHEAAGAHSLTLRAEDVHGDHDEISVTVSVNNLDEAGTLTLSHGALRAGSALTASLQDPDGSISNQTWQWSRASNPITGATGSSYTATTGDVGHVLNASVSYTDGHGPGKSAEARTASAVGNDAPAFPAQTISRAIDENTPAGAAAGDPVTATDPNGDPLTYSMTGAPGFSMDRQTGQIRTASAMDHEARASYAATVTATDAHGAAAQAEVVIAVNNLDEPGTLSLSNAAPRAGDAITASLTDPDGAASNEAWQWRRDGNDIPGATSDSYTADTEDLGHTLSVSVSYEDPQGPGKSAVSAETAAVSNDPPAFTTEDPMHASVRENAPAGTAVGHPLEASDPNGDDLSYALSGPDAAAFSVDGNGQITMTASPDHEARSSYSLTATVSDPAGGSDSITVNVTVENLEEPGAVSFGSDAQPEVNTALIASLSDPDGNVSGETWQWQYGESASGPWTGIQGATSAAYTPTADVVGQYLKVTASYTDGHGANSDTASATTGAVQREPNKAPAFDAATTTFSISINVREGIRVAPPFKATDPNGDTLTYSIVSNTANAFTINQETGEVLMGSADMAVDTTYKAAISVTDGMDDDRNADDSADDSLSLTMTMVNPNIVVEPDSHHTYPYGLWVNDSVAATANDGNTDDRVLFYNRETQASLTDRNFEITTPRFAAPKGIWSDGSTLYLLVINEGSPSRKGKIYGYSLADGARQSSKDINLANANRNPYGLTGRNGRLYVTDSADNRVYAYDALTRSRASDHDIGGIDRMNKQMTDLWLNDETVWVSYWRSDFIRAYDVETGARKPGLDVQTAAENRGPTGIDSDGFNLWALDQVNDTIYGYVLPQ